jgi:outer membrane receptor protein involved in Fe transport
MRKAQSLGTTLLFSFFVLPAFSQVQNGELVGQVTDPTGAIVAGAQVRVHNVNTGLQIDARTDKTGFYATRELPVGHYRITVQAAGFKIVTRSDLALNAGTTLRADLQLVLGQRTEVVEVTGAPALVNTENARLAQTVDATQVANLPLNGRNVYDLIQYAPGAVNARGAMFETNTNIEVNGVRESFNNFLINGSSNKTLALGGAIHQPILDTVQEFQLLTLNNSAEFGNSAGAITNLVTKSGTNNLHGAAWWFVRNEVFDANEFFLNRVGEEKPSFRFNQFGAAAGGPILKNKLFFFVAYQGDRFTASAPAVPLFMESPEFRDAVISTFPNSVAALLYQNFPPQGPTVSVFTLDDYLTAGISPFSSSYADYLCPAATDGTGVLAKKFAQMFGVTQSDIDAMNQPGGCKGGSPFSGPVSGAFGRNQPFLIESLLVPRTQDQIQTGNLFQGNEASLRLDYNLNQHDRVFGQFAWERRTDSFGSYGSAVQMRGFTHPYHLTTPNAQLSWLHMFSPTLLNEARLGYAQNSTVEDSKPETALGVPGIFLDDGAAPFGAYSGFPSVFHEHIYTYSDMVSIQKGSHALKLGAEVRRNLENSNFNPQRPSYYFFDSLFFAADMPYHENAGVDPGIISGEPAHLDINVRHFRNWEFGAYLQDSWKARRNLTLNLGLRYDLYTRHTELDDLGTTFLLGPGKNLIDDLSTGAGRVKSANIPAGLPGCDTPELMRLAQIAGVCGPGGFTTARQLGRGDHNNISPRIGFAWDIFGNGKTALRGGFGLSYEGTLYNPLSNSRWNLPYYTFNGVDNFLVGGSFNVVYSPQTPGELPRFTGPPDPANFQGSGYSAIGNIMAWDPSNPNSGGLTAIVLPEGLRDPYVMNWFFGLQHEIKSNLLLEVNYVGTGGRKLFRADQMNIIPGGRLPESTCATDLFGRKLCSQVDSRLGSSGDPINPVGRLNPNYGSGLRVWRNSSNSNYHSLQVSARQRARSGLTFSASYTWSHSIDDGSTWHSGGTTANGRAGGDAFFSDSTLPQLDRGNSVFDIRHRLSVNYVWDLPLFRTRRGFLHTMLADWQLSGIWAYQTGAHWSPFDRREADIVEKADGACHANAEGYINDPEMCVNEGGDYKLNGSVGDRPSAIASNVNATKQQWADGFNLPDGFFSTPCLGCVGNLGRNTFVGPDYWNVDMSVSKIFALKEQFGFQFRAEAFNVFNRTNFLLPRAFNGAHQITSPIFGQAGGTFNPRQLQFGLRLSF